MIILDIAGNELRRLFKSPLAWVSLTVVQFLLAMFFYILLSRFIESTSMLAGHGLTEIVATGMLQFAAIIMLIICPFLTARLISDELRSGTIKLLLSSPITITELVLGKYLGIMAFLLIMLVMIALMPLSLLLGTPLDIWHLTSALMGLTLLVATFAAIGIFVSSLTQQPAIAAISTFGIIFILWIIHIASNTGSEKLAVVMNYLSLSKHYENMLAGVFNSVDIIYFLLLVTTFVALSIWRLDAMRTYS